MRWRRPGGVTVIRAAVVAALLGTGAVSAWSSSADTSRAAGSPQAANNSQAAGQAQAGGREAGDPADRELGAVQAANRPEASALSVPSGAVGVPVRLAEPAALALLRVGDRVDLLTVGPSGGPAAAIAHDALVLGVTGSTDPTAGGLLLALSRADAQRVVAAAERARFAVLVRPAR